MEDIMQLELDVSVLGLDTLLLSGTISFSTPIATASFRLPQMLPNGLYPCVMRLHGHPIHLDRFKPSSADSGPQTRATARFNSSESAEAAPLVQPTEDHTFMLSISSPIVSLAPSVVSASQMFLCFGDHHADCQEQLSDEMNVTDQQTQLWLSIRGEQVHGQVSVLLAMSASNISVTEADIIAAVQERNVLVSSEDTVVLPLPSAQRRGVSLLWVQWQERSSLSRRLMFEKEQDEFPQEGCFVRVFRAISGLLDRGAQSAWVAPFGEKLENVQPVFSVSSQIVAHRGEDLRFNVTRQGPPSQLESRLLWRVVYLDPGFSTDAAVEMGDISSMIGNIAASGEGFSALKQAGTLKWLPGRNEQSVEVNVPIAWDRVSYTARWMLAVQLSVRQNGAIQINDFTELDGSAIPGPAALPTSHHLSDQLNGIVPLVTGHTMQQATAVQAFVYGVPDGTCAPSMARIAGSAAEPPIQVGLNTTHAIQGISLQVSDHGAGTAATVRFVQTEPPFDGLQRTYSARVPFHMPRVSLAVSAAAGESVLMQGCGTPRQRSAAYRFNSTSTPGVMHHLWPVDKPSSRSMCTASFRSCSAAISSGKPCARGARIDHIQVHWLDDPTYARIESVNITVGGETGQVCSSFEARSYRSCGNSAIRLTSESGQDVCSVGACTPHAVVNTSLMYHRGDTIKIAVQPKPSSQVASVSIGQRVFRASAERDLDRVSVSFKLFDASERLSPFLPFFIRQRTRDRTMIDVPIMLALSDGVTAVPYTLLLDITVLPGQATDVPSELLLDSGAGSQSAQQSISVEVETESAHVAFLTDGVATAEAPIDVHPVTPGRRRLSDVSTSAPWHQIWVGDPDNNPQCNPCPEGFFSDKCGFNDLIWPVFVHALHFVEPSFLLVHDHFGEFFPIPEM